jgi:hypothetical protein
VTAAVHNRFGSGVISNDPTTSDFTGLTNEFGATYNRQPADLPHVFDLNDVARVISIQ